MTDRNGDVLIARLPRIPRYRRRRPPPVGDWHVDRLAATAVLLEQPLDVAAPFTVRLEIRGRALEAVRLCLVGPPRVEVWLRRGLINDDLSLGLGHDGDSCPVVPIPPVVADRVLAVLSTLLRGGAGGCGLLAAACLAAAATRRARFAARYPPRISPRLWWSAVAGLAAAAGIRSAWVAAAVLERVPHVPDGVAYLVQARWLLAGMLAAPAPNLPAHFAIPFTFIRDGRWYSQYPPAWPAMLALGDAVGAAWLVAPALGAVCVVLLALLGREVDRPLAGLVAAGLGVISPLASLLFASHLSHAAAAPLVTAFLWLAIAAERRRRPVLGLPAGLALGFAAGMRPLTAIAIAVPFGLVLLLDLARVPRRRMALRLTAWLLAGGLAGIVPTLLANLLVTGSPLRFAYALKATTSFYGPGRIPWGVRNLDAIVASLPPQLLGLGWPLVPATVGAALALGLVLVPLLRRRPPYAARLLFAVWIAVAAAYVGTQWHGQHGYGPRYHFEASMALLVLAAMGLVRFADVEAGTPDAAGRRRPAAFTTFAFAVMALIAVAALPLRMRLYESYNLVDGSLVAALRAVPERPLLVVFASPRWYDWGRAAPLLPPLPRGDLVFAGEAGDLAEIVAAYPGHHPYLWKRGHLEPVE